MRWMSWISCLVIFVLVGCTIKPTKSTPTAVGNAIRGDYVEGCECMSVCPCVFSQNATAGDCRAVFVWKVTDGSYQGVDMKGVTFGLSLTKSGENVEKSVGNLEGMMFLPGDASEAQRDTARSILQKKFGRAFSKLREKVTTVRVKGSEGNYAVTVEGVAKLETQALKGAHGGIPSIQDAPSPLAPMPKFYLGTSTSLSYDDGLAKFSFKDTNAFFGPFEIREN